MVKSLAAAVALACVAAAIAAAQTAEPAGVRPSVELTLLDTLSRQGDWEASLAATGVGRLYLDATGSDNVKGQLRLDAQMGDTTELSVSRAWVKFRFPRFQTTWGLAPLRWGQGFFYNAADVVFGPVGSTSDLTAAELRDLAVWQSTVFVPLAPFSFVEASVFAPELNLSELNNNPSATPPSVAEAAAGGRVLAPIGGSQIEAGYLYRGSDGTHNPFVSLHGSLFVDFYLGASLELPQAGLAPLDLLRGLLASGGLYHVMRLPDGSSLAARLEALLRPSSAWTPTPGRTDYALLIYPELVWNAGPTVSVLSRNFVSPVDLSALCVVGVEWKLQTGLTFLAFASAQAGEAGDAYGWGRPGDLALITGFRYVD
jgi:hypothetical protein